jgi:hypothetical protein
MSFALSSSNRGSVLRFFNGSGLAILVSLISPLFAVLLSHYLNSPPKYHATFAPLAPTRGAGLHESVFAEPRPELPAIAHTSRNRVETWQEFSPQPEKQALAEKLIARAKGVKNDPASQSIMLRLAKDVATEADDGQTAFQAIDAMADTLHADAEAMKTSVLKRLAGVARRPAQHKSLAEQALKLESQAVGQDHFIVAGQLGRLAVSEAKRALDKELLARAQHGFAEVVERARARQCLSASSENRRPQSGTRLVEKLQPEAEQDNRTYYGDDLPAVKAKRL